MQLWFARFLQIFGKFPQSLRSGAQIIDILAEGKAGVCFSDMTVFVAVELADWDAGYPDLHGHEPASLEVSASSLN